MNLYAPDYYTEFKCIAEKCKHSCCIGWEIQVDKETLCKYKKIQGDFGERLCKNITSAEGEYVFKLNEDERCPFLNENNLCDIIINLGEDSLCQICTDHPRFRNFYENCTEIGLGLACEAAAKLILTKETKTSIITLSESEFKPDLTKQEQTFFQIRSSLFQMVQDKNKSIAERIQHICNATQIILPHLTAEQWAKELLTLEQLDTEWTTFLESISDACPTGKHPTDTVLEQLLTYFIYRHTAPGSISQGLRFALLGTQILTELSRYTDDFINLCRMFSGEIEYSEENSEFIMNF